MFDSGSLLRSVDIYLVENVVQSLVALVLVLAFIHALKIRDSALKIKLYLLPILLPLVAPPLYYLLFPGRPEMPVLKVDRLLALEKLIPYQQDGSLWAPAFALGLILVVGLLLTRTALAVTALALIPRHHHPPLNEDAPCQRTLSRLAARAGLSRPRILLSQGNRSFPGSFGLLGQSYLLLPPPWLEERHREALEPALAHEIAHLKRGDPRLLFLLRLVRGVLFFNPVVYIASAGITHEAELASDQEAVKLGVERAEYGQGLLTAWRVASSRDGKKGPRARELRERMKAVLEVSPRAQGGPRWALPALVTTLGVVLFFLC